MSKVNHFLSKKLKELMSDESLTWEQKHHQIFLDGLKCAIMENFGVDNEDYTGATGSNKSECEHFYEWAINYTKV